MPKATAALSRKIIGVFLASNINLSIRNPLVVVGGMGYWRGVGVFQALDEPSGTSSEQQKRAAEHQDPAPF
jgi:hypothetical protein